MGVNVEEKAVLSAFIKESTKLMVQTSDRVTALEKENEALKERLNNYKGVLTKFEERLKLVENCTDVHSIFS